MKRCVVASLTIIGMLFQAQGHNSAEIAAVVQEYSEPEIHAKRQKFTNMRNGGFIMLGTGAVLLPLGIVFASNATWTSSRTGGQVNMTTNDPSGGVGILFCVLGIPLTAAGTVLGIIGSKKARLYTKAAQEISLRIHPANRSLTLQCTGAF